MLPAMWLSAGVGIGSRKNVSGARRKRFQRLVHPGAQKRKTALKSSGRSLQSSETFVSELSVRTSSDVTAQGTVASPARLPQPFQSLLMLTIDVPERVVQSQIALFFQGLDLRGRDWPKDRLLWPKDRIYLSSAKN